MRKYYRVAIGSLAGLTILAAVALFVLYRAAQHEPEFYQQALRAEPTRQKAAGQELERGMLELHNSARQQGRWQAVFTEEQINGWLASDLPNKFPRMLPKGTNQPRVAIEPDAVRIACRYHNGKVETVVSFALDIDLTTESNTLAVRVSKVRAGALPVPLTKFLNRISLAASRADITLRWSQTEGDPVALVTVPHQHEDYAHREVYVETVELRDGAVFLAGRTEQTDRHPTTTVAKHVPLVQDENETVHQ